jgi:tetratricopeptide (TPR) repeat protein
MSSINKFLLGIVWLFLLTVSCTHLKKANELYNSGQYTETITLCRTAIAADSTDVMAYSLAGQSWFALGQPDSALFYFQSGLHYDSTNTLFAERITLIFVQAGDILLTAKSYSQAIDKYRLALQYKVNESSILEKIGDTWRQSGNLGKALETYSSIKNPADSTRINEKIMLIEDSQKLAAQHITTGKNYFKTNKFDAAKQQFLKALEIEPNSKEAKYYLHMNNAMPLYRKGTVSKLWDAIAEFGYAAAILPDRGEPHFYMAMAYNKKDKDEYSNAISEFELAIQVEPDGEYAGEAEKKIIELKSRRKKMQDFLSH